MKSLVASCLILLFIAAFTLFGSLYISKSLDELSNAVSPTDDIDLGSIYETAENAEKIFLSRKNTLSLLLNDKDIDEIEDYIIDLKSAAESKNHSDTAKAKSRLVSKLEQTRRLCAFNIDSIF